MEYTVVWTTGTLHTVSRVQNVTDAFDAVYAVIVDGRRPDWDRATVIAVFEGWPKMIDDDYWEAAAE